MPYDVFISHSSKDKPTADAITATLESRGIRCWIAPRDIRPGVKWSEAIVHAIKECRVMVLVFSQHANTSNQVEREVQRAFEYGVTVIPFRTEDIAPNESFEYYISSVHWLDALTPPLEQHIARLADSVERAVAGGAGALSSGVASPPRAPAPAAAGDPLPAVNAPSVHTPHLPRTLVAGTAAVAAVALLAFGIRELLPRRTRAERAAAVMPTDTRADHSATDSAPAASIPDLGAVMPDIPAPESSAPPIADEGASGEAAPATVRTAIRAAYLTIDAAMANKNLARYRSLLAPDFVQINADGQTRDRESYLQNTSLMFATASSIKYATRVQRVTMRGKDAVAQVAVRSAVTMNGMGLGVVPSMNMNEVDQDIWTRSGNGWVMKRSKALSVDPG